MHSLLRPVLAILLTALSPFISAAQSVSINTDGSTAHASAMLEVKSTAKGMLIPRMSKTEKNTIASPATGLLIFQNAPDSTGFYFYNGSGWTWLSDNNTAWSTTGNAGTSPSFNFLGTTDNNALVFRTSNTERMRLTSTGNLGVGTTNPLVRFDVAGSATIGSGNTNNATSSLVTGINNSINGIDVLVGGTQNYIAPGYGHTIVAGILDSASASAGAVFGFLNKITAFEAFATGDRNTASGQASAAFGSSNTVSSGNGFVTGANNNVSGAQSAAFGNGNTVTATSSLISGISNNINGVDVLVGGTQNYIAPGYGHTIVAGILDSASSSAGAVFGFLNKITAFEAFATGDRNTASGQASAAFGGSNTVSASNGFVTGTNNNVSGAQSGAFGNANTISGTNSFIQGSGNTLSGGNSLVHGSGNIVTATSSFISGINNNINGIDVLVGGTQNYIAPGYGHTIVAGILDSASASAGAVFGFLNKITAFEAFATGDRNTAAGGASAAFGSSNTVSSSNGFVTGANNNISGAQSAAFGNGNIISGTNSFVQGSGNTVTATGSLISGINNNINGIDVLVGGTQNYIAPGYGHTIVAGILDSASASAGAVFGFLNKITAFEAFAAGDRNTVTGQASAAFGASNMVSGGNAFAAGGGNIASGSTALALGASGTASGNNSSVLGMGNSAFSWGEMAVGLYGTDYTPLSTTHHNILDRIFNVGIGSGPSARADALTILKSGNTGIGTSTPTALLDVNSNTIRLRNAKTPASSTDTGNTGDIAWDTDYIYVCVATNTWKRVAISSW